jgi:hypothetical protein
MAAKVPFSVERMRVSAESFCRRVRVRCVRVKLRVWARVRVTVRVGVGVQVRDGVRVRARLRVRVRLRVRGSG